MVQSRQPRVGHCYWASVTVCIGQVLDRRRRPFRLFKLTDLQPKLGPVSALYQKHYWAMCYFYHGKQILEVRKPEFGTALARCCAENKCWRTELGQNWPPSAYRSYHSSNGTTLAADLRQIFVDAGPVLGRI